MTEEPRADGLVCAYQLDGRGGGEPLTWDEIARPQPRGMSRWVHLDRAFENGRSWLRDQSGLSPLACEALLADETRPRVDRLPDGLIVVFRGVNLNPGENPEDMVSLRLWVDEHRLISVRHRRLMAVQDLREQFSSGDFPRGPGSLLAAIGAQLAWRMEPVIAGLSERVDDLEGEVITSAAGELRTKLAALRREIIGLRRYLAPQRDAMLRLHSETVRWLGDQDRFEIREAADRTTRYIEELDAARERVGVAHEELISRLSEQLNQRMYLLSIIAAIFLPLSLITGLLGINVGGMPGATSDAAFMIVSVLLVAIGIGLALVLRRLRFF
ncbi:MAG TPA: zinc transporter ZntB [Candidatus Deferrimicrobiaceae bacterium]|nr:zinc transporter ZntB [Candidatus Deferrimicrobiaceae bacterium]